MREADLQTILMALAFLGLVGGTAQADEMEGRGRILNADGNWCWFDQTVDKRTADFLGSMPGMVATMTFDDPTCMGEKTKQESADFAASFNRDMIADRIASTVTGNWVTKDTVYDHANRHLPGIMQKSGECLVMKDMPATAIAINFVSTGTSITKVEYAHVYGCGDAL